MMMVHGAEVLSNIYTSIACNPRNICPISPVSRIAKRKKGIKRNPSYLWRHSLELLWQLPESYTNQKLKVY